MKNKIFELYKPNSLEAFKKFHKEIDPKNHKILKEFSGKKFSGTFCNHPFFEIGYDYEIPMFEARFVTTEQGTGIVHVAPGHGDDDYTLGIGILAETNLNKLKEYLPIVDSVLLLCVNPGYSHQNPSVSPVERVKELKTIYPNYNLNISVDGGVSNDMLPELLNLGVDIAVQGGAIFGSD